MGKEVLVSVSSLPAENDILSYVKQIENYADFLHCDIMDGTLTENKTILNFDIVKKINKISTLPLDVHLMNKFDEKMLNNYLSCGANILTIQYEGFENDSQIIKALKKIKKSNILAGLSIDLNTNVNNIKDLIKHCDIVLIMSVKFGKGGQRFNESCLEKVKILNNFKEKYGYKYLIEVDGGINNDNCDMLIKDGVNIIVSGSYIFNETDYQYAISTLKSIK